MKYFLNLWLFLLVSSPLISSLQADSSFITPNVLYKSGKKYGIFSQNRFNALTQELIEGQKNKSELEILNNVNMWVNGIQYISDKKLYNISDYWATLYEFIGKGKGDCEDYVITKYYILKKLGIDTKKLKFTYCIYQNRRGKKVSHMVLSYLKKPNTRRKSDVLILDNTNRLVLPASKRTNIIKIMKMINGDTGAKSKKWKKLEKNMRRKKL